MTIKNNVPVYDISWLNYCNGGTIKTFYEPENKDELIEICSSLYKKGEKFDVIGHASNIYFLPSYNVDVMVSTRKFRNIKVLEDSIVADCGASVSKISRQMVNDGVKGFEGLIDLPGTVAASVFGNASCYGCSINALLESFELLKPDGEIVVMKSDDLKLANRSSALKRGELLGVILSVTLRKEYGDKEELKSQAEANHRKRTETQPGPKDNLGSIYALSQQWTLKGKLLHAVAKTIGIIVKPVKQLSTTKIILYMVGHRELIPYVWGWNRFIWKDEEAHELFWKFHEIHKKLFVNSDFEIIIKGNRVS